MNIIITYRHLKLYRLLLVCVFCFANLLYINGQQTPLYNQYVMSSFLRNPAIAGANGYSNINLISHNQWLGISDAPKTNAVSFQTRIMKSSWKSSNTQVKRKYTSPKRSGQVGLGGYIFSDKSGAYGKTGLQFAYAYHLYIGSSQLSFGLSTTFFQSSINTDELNPKDPDDVVIESASQNNYINDYDFGVYFLHPDLYVGFSVSQLAQSWLSYAEIVNLEYDDKMFRNYQLMGGYIIKVNEEIKIEPTFLFKTPIRRNPDDGSIFVSGQLDVGVKFRHKKGWWTGITYRTKDAAMIYGGVKVDRVFIGYAVDYPINKLAGQTWGSHEVIIAVMLGDNTRKYKYWDRY